MRRVRFGLIILPQRRWAEQSAMWRRGDDLGFDHLWTYDHLTWDPLAGTPWGATMPTLVAAAQVTSRARLGTWVASPNYRHPVPFARELAALDDISGGRAVLGSVRARRRTTRGCSAHRCSPRPTGRLASRSSSSCWTPSSRATT